MDMETKAQDQSSQEEVMEIDSNMASVETCEVNPEAENQLNAGKKRKKKKSEAWKQRQKDKRRQRKRQVREGEQSFEASFVSESEDNEDADGIHQEEDQPPATVMSPLKEEEHESEAPAPAAQENPHCLKFGAAVGPEGRHCMVSVKPTDCGVKISYTDALTLRAATFEVPAERVKWGCRDREAVVAAVTKAVGVHVAVSQKLAERGGQEAEEGQESEAEKEGQEPEAQKEGQELEAEIASATASPREDEAPAMDCVEEEEANDSEPAQEGLPVEDEPCHEAEAAAVEAAPQPDEAPVLSTLTEVCGDQGGQQSSLSALAEMGQPATSQEADQQEARVDMEGEAQAQAVEVEESEPTDAEDAEQTTCPAATEEAPTVDAAVELECTEDSPSPPVTDEEQHSVAQSEVATDEQALGEGGAGEEVVDEQVPEEEEDREKDEEIQEAVIDRLVTETIAEMQCEVPRVEKRREEADFDPPEADKENDARAVNAPRVASSAKGVANMMPNVLAKPVRREPAATTTRRRAPAVPAGLAGKARLTSEELELQQASKEREAFRRERARRQRFYERAASGGGGGGGGRPPVPGAPAAPPRELTVPQSPHFLSKARHGEKRCSAKRGAGPGAPQDEAVPAAEYISSVLNRTPKRYHSKPARHNVGTPQPQFQPRLTAGQGPRLLTEARATHHPPAHPTTEAADAAPKQFKARRLNRKVLESCGDVGVPKVNSAPLTQPKPFSFQTDRRAAARGPGGAGEQQPAAN